MTRLTSSLALALGLAATLSACGKTAGSNGATTGATTTVSSGTTGGATTGASAGATTTASGRGTIEPVTTAGRTGGGGSAHVKSAWVVDGANIAIEYGRPALKGRPEAQMMPAGQPWRTGADAATVLTTDRALTFGTMTLQPGSYTINTQPGATEWQLIVGRLKAPGQWGVPYQPDLEIGRVPMRRAVAAPPAELVTFHVDRTDAGPALRLEWGTVSVSTPFRVQ